MSDLNYCTYVVKLSLKERDFPCPGRNILSYTIVLLLKLKFDLTYLSLTRSFLRSHRLLDKAVQADILMKINSLDKINISLWQCWSTIFSLINLGEVGHLLYMFKHFSVFLCLSFILFFFFFHSPCFSDNIENDMIFVLEGRNATLHCLPPGFPAPNISLIDFSNHIVEVEAFWSFFISASRHKNGSYTCSAANACGS